MNIGLILAGGAIGFLLQTLLLVGLGRFFSTRLRFSKAMKIVLLSFFISFIVGIVLGFFRSAGFGTESASTAGLNPLLLIFGGIEIAFTLAALAYFIREEVKLPWKRSFILAALVTIISWGFIIGSLVFLRTYAVEPFVISDVGMAPTYEEGDEVLVQKIYKQYRRGDVLIFTASDDSLQIGRIVGLPGETVAINKGILTVDGKEVPYHGRATTTTQVSLPAGEGTYITVEDNQFYYPTAVPTSSIVGSVLFAK